MISELWDTFKDSTTKSSCTTLIWVFYSWYNKWQQTIWFQRYEVHNGAHWEKLRCWLCTLWGCKRLSMSFPGLQTFSIPWCAAPFSLQSQKSFSHCTPLTLILMPPSYLRILWLTYSQVPGILGSPLVCLSYTLSNILHWYHLALLWFISQN
jgi:hypothetical protein